jgi:hypothetical protein
MVIIKTRRLPWCDLARTFLKVQLQYRLFLGCPASAYLGYGAREEQHPNQCEDIKVQTEEHHHTGRNQNITLSRNLHVSQIVLNAGNLKRSIPRFSGTI